MKSSPIMARLRARGLATALLMLTLVAAGLFHGVFVPSQTLFSNDGPLGQLMAQCHQLPGRFLGCWLDLNNVGFNGAAAAPSISFGLQWLLGPLWFSKLYAVLSLVILGLGAWCFFRQSKLSAPACLLGGLAAMLNSTYFSVACWGVGAHDITAGMTFFALAALADPAAPRRWLRVILAGMALGMAVTEGADVGAIFSVYAAAFIIYQIWTVEGPRAKEMTAGLGRLMLVIVCALFFAAQSIHGLIDTSIEGVKGTGQDATTKADRWDWATQWSLPKLELLNLVVPGIFGYRMDDLTGQIYWGTMGRAPAWDRYIENGRQGPPPAGFIRFSGGGNYAGDVVVVLAFWAAAQSLRRKNSVFSFVQQKWAWFWLAAAVISLLLALGRFAPFYKVVYELPYFSTIRNPVKFIYPFSFALVVLFALGADGLWRRYMQPSAAGASRWAGLQSWWKRAERFDKNWVWGCIAAWLVMVVAWWAYAAHRAELVGYLAGADIASAPEAVADFSIRHAGWLAAVFLLTASLMVMIFSGAFAGGRAGRGAVFLGLLLVADLGLANDPWIHYWNYQDKYATNQVLELLRDKPYEHRVAMVPVNQSRAIAPLLKLYQTEWLQHEFPANNIQSFETVEMSRMPEDYSAFTQAVNDTNGPGQWFHLLRAWQLSATRYVVGPAGLDEFMGQLNFFPQPPLQLVTQFQLERKPGVRVAHRPDEVTAVPAADGPFALFEFTPALPRAKLYSRWQVTTNEAAMLEQTFARSFDPEQTVLVGSPLPDRPADGTNTLPGSVAITSYAPKNIVLQANVSAPSILLLSDHYDPDWSVFIDRQKAALLRCDFLLRGVQLAPGSHQIEFKFQPPTGWLKVSLAALGTTALVLSLMLIPGAKPPAAPTAGVPVATAPAPASPPALDSRRTDSGKKSVGRRAAKR